MTDAEVARLRGNPLLLQSIVSRAVSLTRDRSGNRLKGRCPFHDDRNPSVKVHLDAGQPHFHCYGCGEHGDVFAFVMRRERCDFTRALEIVVAEAGMAPSSAGTTSSSGKQRLTASRARPNGRGKHQDDDDWHPITPTPEDVPRPLDQLNDGCQVFEYVTPEGWTHHFVGRYDWHWEGKDVPPLTYGVLNGKKGWHKKAPDAPRPLYRLDRLTTAAPDSWVIIVEGERKCEAAERMFPDYVCTSWMGGANSVNTADWTVLKRFREERLIWWPDTDRPQPDGKPHGCFVAAPAFRKMFPRASFIDITGLADRKAGWDAADLEKELGSEEDADVEADAVA